MPLLNSMGVLRDMTMYSSITPIGGQQWIAQYNTLDDRKQLLTVNPTGEVYSVDYGGFGLFKLTNSGAKVYSFYTSSRFNTSPGFVCLDGSNNIYVGGSDSTVPNTYPCVIKYDPSGNILWQWYYKNTNQRVLSMVIAPTGDLFVLTGANGGAPALGNGPYILFRIDSTTGAIINQRKTLKQATSAPSDLTIDNVNNQLIVTGTDYSGTHSTIINGYYNFTNTDVASGMTIQSSTTDDYDSFWNGGNVDNCVTDGTYIYMMGWRTVSGIIRSVYMRVNKLTGAVSYSNAIVISGASTNITGITMDNSGFLYVIGYWAGVSGYSYIAKINKTTGAIVWCKTLGSNSTYETIGNIKWSDGFLYFEASYYITPTPNQYIVSTIKLNSDGSLPDGTYGTYWTFANVAPSLVSYLPQTTGTTTGSTSTTTITSQVSSFTKVTDSTTISTINIP